MCGGKKKKRKRMILQMLNWKRNVVLAYNSQIAATINLKNVMKINGNKIQLKYGKIVTNYIRDGHGKWTVITKSGTESVPKWNKLENMYQNHLKQQSK